LIGNLSGAIAEAQGKKDAIRLITFEPDGHPGKVEMGEYIFDFMISPVRRRGGDSVPAPAADTASRQVNPFDTGILSFLEAPFLVIINTFPDEYYFDTNGNYSFRVSPKSGGNIAATSLIERGAFINGQWVSSGRLNDDDIMRGGYDISGAAANRLPGTLIPVGSGRNAPLPTGSVPAPPMVTRVRLYRYR
jgi:hypothetical protein